MKTLICFFVSLIVSGVLPAQNVITKKRLFSDTEQQINQYRKACQAAWDKGDEKLARTYYDSIEYCINNSYVGNHRFRTVDNRIFDMGKMKKPVFLIVSASWCAPCIAELPAINKIAKEYHKEIDFIVLFWDTKKTIGKLIARYDNRMYLVPSLKSSVDEAHTITIGGFKHFIGYPTNYLITSSKKIIKSDQGATIATTFTGIDGKNITITEKQAFDLNYKRLKEDVELLLQHK